MPNWFTRLGGALSPVERKSGGPQTLMTLTALGEPSWSRRGFVSLANAGFMRNPVVYRAIRMIAEAATRVPLVVEDGGSGSTRIRFRRCSGGPMRGNRAASCSMRSIATC